MRNSFLYFIVLSSFVLACKKDKPDNSYHCSATVEGKKIVFSEYMSGKLTVDNGYYRLILTSNTLTAGEPSFSIQLLSAQPITTDIYTDTTSNMILAATMNYNNKFYNAGSMYPNLLTNNNYQHFSVNITSLDKNLVRGTFSGDLFNDLNYSIKSTISDGDFYLQMEQ